jgi:hypothetical protein
MTKNQVLKEGRKNDAKLILSEEAKQDLDW